MFESEYPVPEAGANLFTGLINQVNKNPYIVPISGLDAQKAILELVLKHKRPMTCRELSILLNSNEHVIRSCAGSLVTRNVLKRGAQRGTFVAGANALSGISGQSRTPNRIAKENEIVECLRENAKEGVGRMAVRDIAEYCDIPVRTASWFLTRMKEDGVLTISKLGSTHLWELADASIKEAA